MRQAVAVFAGGTEPAPERMQQQPRKRVERGYVELRNVIDGDVLVTGGQLVLYGEVHGDLRVRGGRATVHGMVTGDVINEGGHVVVLGEVGGTIVGPRDYTVVERPKRRAAPAAVRSGPAPMSWISKLGYASAAASLLLILAVSLTLRDTGDNPEPETEVAGAVELRDSIAVDPLSKEAVEVTVAPASPEAEIASGLSAVIPPPSLDEAARIQPEQPAVLLPQCHPNYTGCVPIAIDVDCAFRGLDGPEYVGQVEVIGEDVYELDADGDAITCNE
ncbi:MAG: hypothetical protein HKN26_01590 [Acidimicrobiales bacterium]|nr:hypothetical protein [Acidimicrobiales bacterium]